MFELLENGKVKKKWSLATLNIFERKGNIISNARLVGGFIYISTSNGWIVKVDIEKQKVVYENTKLNEDILAVIYEDGILAIVIMMIREGRLIDKKDFVYFVENIE